MCFRCEAVRRTFGDAEFREEPFEVTDAMLLDYAQRHGVTYDDALDAFIFAAGNLHPSRRVH
jgi:hypothetical protein